MMILMLLVYISMYISMLLGFYILVLIWPNEKWFRLICFWGVLWIPGIIVIFIAFIQTILEWCMGGLMKLEWALRQFFEIYD